MYESANFESAVKEFERVLFMAPANDTIKLYLIKSYRKGMLLPQALVRHGELSVSNPLLIKEWDKEEVRCNILNGDVLRVDSLMALSKTHTPFEQSTARCLAACTSINWKSAQNIGEKNNFKDSSNTQMLYDILNSQATEKYRKPGVAMALSTVVPGLGKVYAGRWKDGIMSFVFVGVSAFQAYRAFNQVGIKTTRGWIFATLGTGFYVGNIYGSFHAARLRNKRINEKYLLRINSTIDSIY